MAMSLGGGNGRGRRGSLMPLAEINVTPFVDVVLVLLIIFMLTAHVMEYGLEVNVPQTKSVRSSTRELPVVTLTKTGAVYLGQRRGQHPFAGRYHPPTLRRAAGCLCPGRSRNAVRPHRTGDQRTWRSEIPSEPGHSTSRYSGSGTALKRCNQDCQGISVHSRSGSESRARLRFRLCFTRHWPEFS